jgi:glycosyltransferase involved in cell wall biosynthesis
MQQEHPRFFVQPETAYRLSSFPGSKVFLVGGFNGYWNFGDAVQLMASIHLHRSLEPERMLLPLVHTRTLQAKEDIRLLKDVFELEDWLYYSDDVDQHRIDISFEPVREIDNSAGLLLHVYGGGFFNRHWGLAKIQLIEALFRSFPITNYVLSGQQFEPSFLPYLLEHFEHCTPSIIGCRDRLSLDLLQQTDLEARFSFDDAFESFERAADAGSASVEPEPSFALHLNLSDYVFEESNQVDLVGQTSQMRMERLFQTLRSAFGEECNPLVLGANLSGRLGVPECWIAVGRLDFPRYYPRFEALDLVGHVQTGRLAEAAARLKTRRLLVSHSYHVALLGLFCEVPTYLVGASSYYQQKQTGLGMQGLSLGSLLQIDLEVVRADQEKLLQDRRSVRKTWLGAFKEKIAVMQREHHRRPSRKRRVPLLEERQAAEGVGSLFEVEPAAGSAPERSQKDVVASEVNRALQARVRSLERRFSQVVISRSWRWTQPLRRFHFKFTRWLEGRGQRGIIRRLLEFIPVTEATAVDQVRHKPATQIPQSRWEPSKPIVSVVIPCYNYGHFLEEALESIYQQTLQDFEIIVVDDGSDDPHTLALLSMLSGPKLSLMRQDNQGISIARNTGIRSAEGKYICCLDADDALERTYLEKTAALLESQPDVGFAYSWVQRFGDADDVYHTQPFNLNNLLAYNLVSVSAVFRREAWERVGGYWPNMRPGYEDWEFWIQLASRGYLGRLIPEPLLFHRKHDQSKLDRAVHHHAELIEKIRTRHAGLYRNPRRVEQIEEQYGNRLVDHPFINISRTEQYFCEDREVKATVILGERPGDSLWKNVAHQDGTNSHEGNLEGAVLTTLRGDAAADPSFDSVNCPVYHLPHFLPPHTWADFILNFVDARRVDRLYLVASNVAHSLLPELRSRSSELEIFELVQSPPDPSYIETLNQDMEYLDEIRALTAESRRALEGLGVDVK